MLRRFVVATCSVLAVATAVPAAGFDLNLAAGIDFSGDFDLGALNRDSQTGYSLGLELTVDLLRSLEVGVGVEYGIPRSPDEPGADDLSYTNLYGVARLHLVGDELPVYAVGRLGYGDISSGDLVDGGLDGGGSWSVGAGVELMHRLKLELLLNNFNADVDVGDVTLDVDYQTYSLRALYIF